MKVYSYNGKSYTDIEDLKQSMPGVSFPKKLTESMLKAIGVKISVKRNDKAELLNAAINKKLAELDIKFKDSLNKPASIVLEDGTFLNMDITEHDILMIRGSIDMLEYSHKDSGLIVDHEDCDHENVPLKDIKNIYIQMLNAYNSLYSKYRKFRNEICDVSEVSELKNISIRF